MEQYLKQTDMLNFHEKEIQQLIHLRKWKELDEFYKIKEIYQFVQNEIVFGYNCCDTLNATQVLACFVQWVNKGAIAWKKQNKTSK